jgi:AraC family transcriptional regulator, exoenzyme S synthesis regulatory protein ExsA
MLKILPQLFYQTPEVEKLLVDGLSCIIHKKLTEPVLNKEGYVSTHAITLVLKGLLQIERDNGVRIQVQENQMVFQPKGLYNISDIIPEGGTFEAMVFFFDEELITSFVTDNKIRLLKDKCVSYKIMEYKPVIQIFVDSLMRLHRENALGNKKLTRIKLIELLHLLSLPDNPNCFADALATLHNKERKSLREFMQANFSKPLSIEDYAYLTGRSLSSFRRDFVEQFGISPKQWLIDHRLEKARILLSKNNTNVSQVALDVGYENISHFVKAFHQKFGISPKQYLISARKAMLV